MILFVHKSVYSFEITQINMPNVALDFRLELIGLLTEIKKNELKQTNKTTKQNKTKQNKNKKHSLHYLSSISIFNVFAAR